MADRTQPLASTRLPSLEELEAMPIVAPAVTAATPSSTEQETTQARPQLPSLAELEAEPKRVLPTFEELADVKLPTSVSGKPLSPETQKILIEREKEKKAYETGYLGMGDIFKPEAREAIGGLWAALTTGKRTPEAEIKALAEYHEVSPEALREVAPFLLAIPEEKTLGDVNMQALGYVSEVAAGLPTFLVKKGLVDDPNMRAAMDDLRAMSKERLGLAEWVGINAVPGALAAKVLKGGAAAVKTGEAITKGLARQMTKSAITGAAFGLGSSKEGEEVTDTIINAGVGAGMAAALKAVPAAKTKIKDTFFKGSEKALQQADTVTQDTAIKYAANNEADITNAIEVVYPAIKDTEDAIRDAALKNRPMSPETASKVVAEMMTNDQKNLAERSIADRFFKSIPRKERPNVTIPEGTLSDEAIAAEYVRMRQATFAEKIVKEAKDLATIIDEKTGKPRPASVKEVLREAQRLGADELDAKWDDAVKEQLAMDLIEKKNIQLGDQNPVGKMIANFFGGRQFGFKVIDERSGADVIPPFLQTNSNLNLVTAERQRWRKFDKNDPTGTISGIYRAGKAVKDFLKLATAQDETNKYWTALAHQNPEIRKATYDALSDAEKKLLGYVSNFFNKVRERANSVKGEGINPLNIPFREDFGAPNVPVNPTQYVIKLKGKLKSFEEAAKIKLKDLQSEDLSKALGKNKDLQDLVAGLRLIDEKLVDESLTSGESLMKAMRVITSGSGRGEALYKVAGTALARRGSIPEYLMEKNLFKLMDRYMDSTMRNVYLRRPLEELASKARILDKMGMETEANFVRRFVQDHYGIRAWSASKLYGEAQVAASDMARSVAKKVNLKPENEEALVAAVNYIPEAIANIQYNIYPNVLGMNGKSHVTNLLQAWTKGAPELGRLYGYSNVGRSFFTTMAPGNWKRLMGKVKEWGLLPDTYVKEFAPAVEEGLARSTGWQFTKEQYQKFVKAWMYTYGKVEDFNRMVIVNMSETLVQDAIDGNKGAVRAIAKMPLAIRRAYIRNKGNPEQQTKIVAKYLNSVTGYNYNRSSMAEVGVHLGPFFATFTKWPTETLGDILADMRIHGTGKAMPRLLEKYALTLALMNGIDATLHWAATDNFSMFPDLKETEPQVRYWLGTSGLKTAAPILSLGQLMPATKEYERNPFTPVVLSTMWNDILMPAWEGDTEKMRSGGMRALQTFAPFGMMSRFMMRDIPMAFEGEEPIKFKGK